MSINWKVGVGIGIAAMIAIGFNFGVAKSQAQRDAESLLAQRRAGGSAGPGGGPQGMMQELGLTEDQQKRMDEVMKDLRPAMGQGQQPDPSQMQARMEKMRQAMDQILTPEQKKKMESMRPPEMPGGMTPNMGPGALR
jgi:Spy/CpxP family protein refolding chaperone